MVVFARGFFVLPRTMRAYPSLAPTELLFAAAPRGQKCPLIVPEFRECEDFFNLRKTSYRRPEKREEISCQRFIPSKRPCFFFTFYSAVCESVRMCMCI